jgi:hypothetical protein
MFLAQFKFLKLLFGKNFINESKLKLGFMLFLLCINICTYIGKIDRFRTIIGYTTSLNDKLLNAATIAEQNLEIYTIQTKLFLTIGLLYILNYVAYTYLKQMVLSQIAHLYVKLDKIYLQTTHNSIKIMYSRVLDFRTEYESLCEKILIDLPSITIYILYYAWFIIRYSYQTVFILIFLSGWYLLLSKTIKSYIKENNKNQNNLTELHTKIINKWLNGLSTLVTEISSLSMLVLMYFVIISNNMIFTVRPIEMIYFSTYTINLFSKLGELQTIYEQYYKNKSKIELMCDIQNYTCIENHKNHKKYVD